MSLAGGTDILVFFAELKGLNLGCKALAKALPRFCVSCSPCFGTSWSWDDYISIDFVLFPQVLSLGSSLSVSVTLKV